MGNELKTWLGGIAILFAICACAVAAPFVAFAVKAGILRVPVDEDTNVFVVTFRAVCASAVFVFALMFFSVFWHIGLAAWFPPLASAFVRYYRSPGCVQFCEITAWWNMLGEAWPYFLATTVTLFARAWADRRRGVDFYIEVHQLWPNVANLVIVPLVGAIAFLFFLYGDQVVAAFERSGVARAALIFVRRWIEEIASIADPIVALLNGGTFSSWLQDEVTKLHLSLFKLSALYPKVFWIFTLFGIGSLFRHRDINAG